MIKTNALRKTKTIHFHDNFNTDIEYRNRSFEYLDPIEATDDNPGRGASFKDWVNGKPGQYIKRVSDVSSDPSRYTIERNNFDTEFFSRRFSVTLKGYVEAKLLQRLNIHRGELDYKFEDANVVGIPYLDKLSTDELDLFIKDTITSTVGVKEIIEYVGSLREEPNSRYGSGKLSYHVGFRITTEEGEDISHSIEI